MRASRSQAAASFGAAVTNWPSTTMPLRKSFFWKAASASLAQLRGRLGDGAGVALDLRLELDGGLVEIAALEGLVAVGGERGT